MTTTYDPFHPKYFDEADLRDELTRVYDLCHGCRLCFKFCTSFPTLFEIDRRPRRPGRRPAHPGPAGPGRRRVLPVQALLHQLPVHPRPARVEPRLPPPDDAGRRRCGTPTAQVTARSKAAPTRCWAAPTCWASSASPPAPLANKAHRRQPGSLHPQGHGEDRRRRRRARAAARTPGSGSRPGSRSAPQGARRQAPGPGRACSRPASSSTRNPAIGQDLVQGLRAQRHRVLAARRARSAAARRGCTAATSTTSSKRAAKNVKVLADAVRAGNDIVVPQPTCGYVLKKDYVDYVGGPDAELVADHTYDAAEYLMKVHKGDGTDARHRLHRRGPRGDHLPRAVPPAGPEHRLQEPRPDEAHRHQDHAGRRVLGHRRHVGLPRPRTTRSRRQVAEKMADAIDEGRRRRRGRRLPPGQRRHPAGDRHAARCTRSRSSPGPTASPRTSDVTPMTAAASSPSTTSPTCAPTSASATAFRAQVIALKKRRRVARRARSSRSCSRTATPSASRSRRWPGSRSSSPTRPSRPSSTPTTRSSPSRASCRATLFIELTTDDAAARVAAQAGRHRARRSSCASAPATDGDRGALRRPTPTTRSSSPATRSPPSVHYVQLAPHPGAGRGLRGRPGDASRSPTRTTARARAGARDPRRAARRPAGG